MISVRNRASQIGQYMKASCPAVASQSRPVVKVFPKTDEEQCPAEPAALTAAALGTKLPQLGCTMVTAGSFTSGQQIRLAHTDLRVPNFDDYRLKSRQDPTAPSSASEVGVKTRSYLIIGAGALAGTYAAKSIVTQFVSTLSASADVLALAKIEVKLSNIPEGEFVVGDLAHTAVDRVEVLEPRDQPGHDTCFRSISSCYTESTDLTASFFPPPLPTAMRRQERNVQVARKAAVHPTSHG